VILMFNMSGFLVNEKKYPFYIQRLFITFHHI